jgi:hypothetical protein
LGFFEQPVSTSAALARTRQNFFKAMFMRSKMGRCAVIGGFVRGAARLLQ